MQLLFDEYHEVHPDGYGYNQFCQLFRQWRGRIDVVMRQDHMAGEKLFVAFSGLTIPIYDEATLEVSYRAELFGAVMGAFELPLLQGATQPGPRALGERQRALL